MCTPEAMLGLQRLSRGPVVVDVVCCVVHTQPPSVTLLLCLEAHTHAYSTVLCTALASAACSSSRRGSIVCSCCQELHWAQFDKLRQREGLLLLCGVCVSSV